VEPRIVLVAAITNLDPAHWIDDNNSPPGLLYPAWLAERSRDFVNSKINIGQVSVSLLIALQQFKHDPCSLAPPAKMSRSWGVSMIGPTRDIATCAILDVQFFGFDGRERESGV
jgi:hypothetical protein